MTKRQKDLLNARLMELSNKIEDCDIDEEGTRQQAIYYAELEGIRNTIYRLGYWVASNLSTNWKYQIITPADDE